MAKLYICPTPIGNLEDLTLRAVRVLKEADLIAAEDTRRTLQLLNYLNIRKHLISLHEHNENKKSDDIIAMIQEGKKVVLVSDAGMPGISDPGELLICKAIEQLVEVEVLLGGTAFVTALIGSGLPASKFFFAGFLNRLSKYRRKELEKLKNFPHTMIFYESPHRVLDTLEDMHQVLGDRRIVIARELTKRYEEYIRTTITVLLEKEWRPQGEMVLIVEGVSNQMTEVEEDPIKLKEELKMLIQEGKSLKEASKMLAQQYGRRKKEIYEMGLSLKEDIWEEAGSKDDTADTV